MIISPIRGRAPAKRTITKFGLRGRVADLIICFKFYRNRLRGFRAVMGQNRGLPLTLAVALTTGQHYRAACDEKPERDVLYLRRHVLQIQTTDRFLKVQTQARSVTGDPHRIGLQSTKSAT